jgi:5-methylcytosine-specific restriction protein A
MLRTAQKRTADWSRWYGTARWKRIARQQMRREPLCRMCREEGRTTAATVADHIVPHRGDPFKFWSGKLQSLCYSHHNASKKRAEARGFDNRIGSDGWPTDPNHPAYGLPTAPRFRNG